MGLTQQKAARRTYWGPAMTESQYAVFHFDVKTMSMRDAQGGNPSDGGAVPLIFDNLAGVERYSQEQIDAMPGLGCQIYDRDEKIVGIFADTQVYGRFHGPPAAKRSLLVGILCLLIGVAFIEVNRRLLRLGPQ